MRTFVETFADTWGISEREAMEQIEIAADVCGALSMYIGDKEPYAVRTIRMLNDARTSIELCTEET
jgi:hypothetical protein